MKKALMVATVASMIEKFNMKNIEILQEKGYEVHVACNFLENSHTSVEYIAQFKLLLSQKGIPYHHISFSRSPFSYQTLIAFRELKQLITSECFDLVHSHTPVAGVISRIIAKLCGVDRNIYTAHGFHFFKGSSILNWIIYFPIEWLMSFITDDLITINDEDYKCAKANFHAKQTHHLNGVGVETSSLAISLNALEREQLRDELGFSKKDFVFLSIGELSKRKNQSIVIKALARLNRTDVKYLIVGTGEQEEIFKQLAKTLGVDEQVIFLGHRNDVPKLLNIADAFIFPSLQEGLPMALMEAMAVGLPIVCSDIRGNRDLITQMKGGYLYPPTNIDGFVDGMERIISSIDKEDMTSYNLKKLEIYHLDKISAQMEHIYE